jgi:hypothetical protein
MSRATLALDRRALEQFIVLDPNPPSHLRTTRHFKAQCHQGPFQERRSHYLTLLCLAFFFGRLVIACPRILLQLHVPVLQGTMLLLQRAPGTLCTASIGTT